MTKKFILWFHLILLGFTASAASIVMIPLIGYLPDDTQKAAGYIVAVIFWLGIILGCVLTYLISGLRKELRNRIPHLKTIGTQNYPGILKFRKKTKNICVYAVFLLGLTVIVCDIINTSLPPVNEYLMFIIVALTYYSFLIHCVIDGKNYKIYKFLKKGDRHGSKKY